MNKRIKYISLGDLKPVLFVRKGCIHCQNTLDMLNEEKKTNEVEIVDISDVKNKTLYMNRNRRVGMSMDIPSVVPLWISKETKNYTYGHKSLDKIIEELS